MDWAVRERGIQRAEWRTNAANRRSIGVAKRLGMRRDGTLRQFYPGPAGRIDMEIWSVLAEEWRARETVPDGSGVVASSTGCYTEAVIREA